MSELGTRQSKELPSQIGDKYFDAFFTSDLKRGIEASQLGFGNQYDIIQDKRLREANYGGLNGHPESDFELDEYYVDRPFPSGESYRDGEKRVADFLSFLKDNYDGKHVAILAHKAPQFALEVLCNGKKPGSR